MTTTAPNRRERLRTATLAEIKDVARRLLVTGGPGAVSLRAIAREMGMTPAALYRYYPSLEELVAGVCADLYDECREHLERARDACPPDDTGAQVYAVCRAFRRWSIEHQAEFGLMFGSPVADIGGEHDKREPHLAAMRFALVFATLFAQLWAKAPFPIPADDEIDPTLRVQLESYIGELGTSLPAGAAQLFLSCWIRLYGMVALEVFGHLHFALTEPEPMFEAELRMATRQLGLPPG
jgi:AcrR family transcriptional regulator